MESNVCVFIQNVTISFFPCEPLLQNVITLYFDADNDDGAARLKVNNVSESYHGKKHNR